ncbi:type II toxin-antitoxin system HicB family antitoxin [Marinomonas agarivorans]|nr:type II toxin-antitoxin system HicB family antitoxin [Marinomonas agarivorans]
MLYPVVVHKDEGSSYGVTVPDLLGCFSAGETFEEALANTRIAMDMYFTDLAESGEDVPLASSVEHHITNPDYTDGIWAVVDMDISAYSGKSERINITLPKFLIKQIDKRVTERNLKSRSTYLAEAAMAALSG